LGAWENAPLKLVKCDFKFSRSVALHLLGPSNPPQAYLACDLRWAQPILPMVTRCPSPAHLGNVRLIRFSANANKLPSYYVDDETQWPTGMFVWGADAERTGYALKRKPVSAKTVGRAMPVSRHLPTGDNRAMDNKPRKVSSVDEVCVALCQAGDDLTDLRLFAHRLRSVPAQYDDDTVAPFPLHELLLLGRAVTA
jgi:RNase H domain-containing protein